jgi:hypothetical protein
MDEEKIATELAVIARELTAGRLLFKRKMSKRRFETELAKLFAKWGRVSSRPHQERSGYDDWGDPIWANMMLYYGGPGDEHIGTWQDGEGWVFNKPFLKKARIARELTAIGNIEDYFASFTDEVELLYKLLRKAEQQSDVVMKQANAMRSLPRDQDSIENREMIKAIKKIDSMMTKVTTETENMVTWLKGSWSE